MSEVFLTVLSGVLVFVIGQLFMRFYIEPVLEFRKSIGRVIHFFLTNRSKITNTNASFEQQVELKRLGGEILAAKQAIPHYCKLRWFFSLPEEESVLEACQVINEISVNMVKDTSHKKGGAENGIENLFAISKLEENLGVKLDFTR